MDLFDYNSMSIGILVFIFIYLVYSYVNHKDEPMINLPINNKETFDSDDEEDEDEQSNNKDIEEDIIIYEGKTYQKNEAGKYVLKSE